MKGTSVAIVAVVANRSKSGKTTLIASLLPIFKARGYRVAAIKHAPHGFEMDTPGKDTHTYKRAGADAVAAVSPGQMALIQDVAGEMTPQAIAGKFFGDMDLVIVEGFKKGDFPKIEVVGPQTDDPPLRANDPAIIMSVCPRERVPGQRPVFAREDMESLVDLIEKRFLFPKKSGSGPG